MFPNNFALKLYFSNEFIQLSTTNQWLAEEDYFNFKDPSAIG